MKKILIILMAIASSIVSAQTKLEFVKYSNGKMENIKETPTPVDTVSFIGIDSLSVCTNRSIFLLGGDTVDLGRIGDNIIGYEWFTRIGVISSTKAYYNKEKNKNVLIPQVQGRVGFAWELTFIFLTLFALTSFFQRSI